MGVWVLINANWYNPLNCRGVYKPFDIVEGAKLPRGNVEKDQNGYILIQQDHGDGLFRQLFEAAASFIGDRGAYDSTTDTYDGLSASPVIFIWDLDLEIDARYFSFQYNLDSLVDDESIFASINGNLLFLNFAQSFSPGIWNYSGLIDLISLCGPAGQSGDRISDGTGWCPASVAEYSVVFRSPGTGDDCDLRDCACWHRSDRTATPSYGSLTLRLKSQASRLRDKSLFHRGMKPGTWSA